MLQADGYPVQIVTTSSQLADLCQSWSQHSALAIDTEFIRTDTFYAKLGLVQVGDGQRCYLIDPLEIDDWAPFLALLDLETCEIVMHSAGEDLNLLQTSLSRLPARLFDTQLASGFLGLGFSMSYQALVLKVLGISVAKDETRSDWLRRPLSEAQLKYAALDVAYLLQLRETLLQSLAEANKLAWFEAEAASAMAQAAEFEQEQSWAAQFVNMNNAWRLSDPGLVILQRLYLWREREARRRDRPKNWIAKDSDLMAIARHLESQEGGPELEDLYRVNELNRKLVQFNGRSIIKAIVEDTGESLPARSLLNTPLPPAQRKLLKRCQQVVRDRAESLQLAPELLATKRQLLAQIRAWEEEGELPWQGAMSGWRRAILEPKFTDIFDLSANS
mgnify:CR=1 FL=1